MKKLSLLFLSLLLLCTACQKTPESPIVVRKDTDQLIDKAVGNENGNTITHMLNAPPSFEGSASRADGTFTINVNAKVTIPNAKAIPTIRVSKRQFAQKDIDKAISFLVGDEILYSATSAAAGNMSKSEIETEIIVLRQKLDALLAENPNAVGGEAEQTAMKLRELEAAYETAPESKSRESISTTLNQYESGKVLIEGVTDGSSGTYQYFSIQNHAALSLYKVIYISSEKKPMTTEPICFYSWNRASLEKVGLNANEIENTLPALSINEDAAKNTAEKAIADIGISNMVYGTCNEAIIVSGDTQYRAYVLEYVRAIDGTPVQYTDNNVHSATAEERQKMMEEDTKYSLPWAFEKVEFIIDDSGIRQFVWESPYKLEETITQNTKLLSFNEIKDILMKMLLVTNVYQSENVDVEMNIIEARLGLMRITEKNNTDTALLVPVWDFFGTVAYKSGEHTIINDDMLMSRLTINAIDGSIIERQLGY